VSSLTVLRHATASGPAGALFGGAARLAGGMAGLRGWRRAAAALVLGLLSALALPPFNIVPVLFIAFPVLLWLLDGAPTGRSAFFTGWWFGFGHHLVGLYWIGNAFLVDAVKFAWLIPLVCSGLPAYLAIFVGAAGWAARRLAPSGVARVLVFAAAWGVSEWLRAWLFTGFPWNLIGYAWTDLTAMLQVTALVGIYGLSVLTVLAAAAPSALVAPDARIGKARTSGQAAESISGGAFAVSLVAFSWALLVLAGLGGAIRLALAPDVGAPGSFVDGVRLRIVQASIPQQMKWDAPQRLSIFRKHLDLSARPPADPAAAPPTHVIWPETAVPFFLENEPTALQAIDQTLPEAVLLTGSPRAARDAGGSIQIWNSLLAVGGGRVLDSYDKFHLVPLGEYVPLRAWLNLPKITPGAVDFTPGPGPRTLHLSGSAASDTGNSDYGSSGSGGVRLPGLSPLICYEVIFPGAVVGEERPVWLLNITNDGWYGRSTGPYQHLQIARVRAVEEGMPLVRAANNGISAVVDGYGRELARLGLDEVGVIDAGLPVALSPTPYSRIGNAALLMMIAVLAVAAVLARPAESRRSSAP
jgi:apolipoprotein N-acyltransferase